MLVVVLMLAACGEPPTAPTACFRLDTLLVIAYRDSIFEWSPHTIDANPPIITDTVTVSDTMRFPLVHGVARCER